MILLLPYDRPRNRRGGFRPVCAPLIAVLAVACAGAPAGDSAADTACTTPVTWQNFADGFFASYCRSCHSSTTDDRYGAPVGVDFDTEDQVRAQEAAVRRTVLDGSAMPPGGGLLPDDLALLREWVECGAP